MLRIRFVVLMLFVFSRAGAVSCAQEPNTAATDVPAPGPGHAGLQRTEKPTYHVELRFVAVGERIYDFLRESAPICEQPNAVRGPFDGWQKIEPGQKALMQRASVEVPQSEFDIAIVNDEQMFWFIQAAQGDTRSNILMAPKLHLLAGETGTFSDLTSVYCQKKNGSGETADIEVKEGTEVAVRVTPRNSGELQVDVAMDLIELTDRQNIDVLDSGVLSRVPKQQKISIGCSGIVKNKGNQDKTLVLLPKEFPVDTEPRESPIRKVSQKIGLQPARASGHVIVVCVTVVPVEN